jgi:hypothetical protein
MSGEMNGVIDQALIELLRPLVRDEAERREQDHRWLTVRQAAEQLGTSPASVYKRVARGLLVSRKLDGRVYVDIEEFYDRLGQIK